MAVTTRSLDGITGFVRVLGLGLCIYIYIHIHMSLSLSPAIFSVHLTICQTLQQLPVI